MGGGILHPAHSGLSVGAGSAPDSEWPLAGLQCPPAPRPVHTGRRELGQTLKALSALARGHRAGWLGPERARGPLHSSARWLCSLACRRAEGSRSPTSLTSGRPEVPSGPSSP